MGRWDDPKQNDPVDAIVKLRVLGTNPRQVKRALMQASLAGFSGEEVLMLAQEGLFGSSGSSWIQLRSYFNVAKGNARLIKQAIAADISPAELAEMRNDPAFSADAVETIAQVRETFAHGSVDATEPVKSAPRTPKITTRDLREKLNRDR